MRENELDPSNCLTSCQFPSNMDQQRVFHTIAYSPFQSHTYVVGFSVTGVPDPSRDGARELHTLPGLPALRSRGADHALEQLGSTRKKNAELVDTKSKTANSQASEQTSGKQATTQMSEPATLVA